jgi:ribonuclease D
VQLAWDDQVVLVDPLAVDIAPMAELLDGPGLAVVHAASQDLEVLLAVCGTVPARLFDTQLAAGFLGSSTPSLATLLSSELGVRLPKADRLSDWLKRPLTPRQLDYAASDVAHLVELHAKQERRLVERGRLAWAEGEFATMVEDSRTGRDPMEAWRRVKEARRLRDRPAAVAQAVAAWRERRAAELNRPVRHILSDLAIVAIAQRAPHTIEELADVRGVDKGISRGAAGKAILEAIEIGLTAEPPEEDAAPELRRELRPAATLASAWLAQHARDLDLDPGLLATRTDIEAYLSKEGPSRLRSGWRAEVVGKALDGLVDGSVSVAFDNGELVLEERSHVPAAPLQSDTQAHQGGENAP